jgi:hypothetical protein
MWCLGRLEVHQQIVYELFFEVGNYKMKMF